VQLSRSRDKAATNGAGELSTTPLRKLILTVASNASFAFDNGEQLSTASTNFANNFDDNSSVIIISSQVSSVSVALKIRLLETTSWLICFC